MLNSVVVRSLVTCAPVSGDNLIEEIGEHHGLLQGVLETCLKEDYPEHYARVIDITYRFSEGWRRLLSAKAMSHAPIKWLRAASASLRFTWPMAATRCRNCSAMG